MTALIGVILSGCGRMDGSEIKEAVFTLLALDKAQAKYQCLAPNLPQSRVVNHYTGEVMPHETRNMLVEAARISHAPVQDLATATPMDFSALIFPGGLGAAQNLSTFAQDQAQSTILPIIRTWVEAMRQAHRPVGFICIAPTMIPQLYPAGVQMTIGNDPNIAAVMTAMGAQHMPCSATDIVIDPQHRVVSTPAYMRAKNTVESALGIEKLVEQVLQWTNNESN